MYEDDTDQQRFVSDKRRMEAQRRWETKFARNMLVALVIVGGLLICL